MQTSLILLWWARKSRSGQERSVKELQNPVTLEDWLCSYGTTWDLLAMVLLMYMAVSYQSLFSASQSMHCLLRYDACTDQVCSWHSRNFKKINCVKKRGSTVVSTLTDPSTFWLHTHTPMFPVVTYNETPLAWCRCASEGSFPHVDNATAAAAMSADGDFPPHRFRWLCIKFLAILVRCTMQCWSIFGIFFEPQFLPRNFRIRILFLSQTKAQGINAACGAKTK